MTGRCAAGGVLAALALLGAIACGFEPRSGQFRCDTGACPTGLVCVAGLCVSPDAASLDAGERVDATSGLDAATPDGGADAGGPPPCESDFCASFDDVARPQDDWTVAEVAGTGAVRLVEEPSAPSAPFVLESSVDVPPPAAAYHPARLSYQDRVPGYETATPRLALRFRFRWTRFRDNPGVTVAAIRYGTGEAYVVLALNPDAVDPARVNLTYYFSTEGAVEVLQADLQPDRWYDLGVVIPMREAAAGEPVGGGVTFEVDDTPFSAALFPAPLTVDMRFDVGLATTNPEAREATAQYDDVRIDYR